LETTRKKTGKRLFAYQFLSLLYRKRGIQNVKFKMQNGRFADGLTAEGTELCAEFCRGNCNPVYRHRYTKWL